MKSAPTILTLKHRSVFDPEKIVSKKQGAKNRARIFFCYSEREEASWPYQKFKLQAEKIWSRP